MKGKNVSKTSHVLRGNELWVFSQPLLGFSTHYKLTDHKTKKSQITTLRSESSCRETLIFNIRQVFQNILYTKCRTGTNQWAVKLVKNKDLDLTDNLLKTRGMTVLNIGKGVFGPTSSNFVKKFIKVTDIVMGPLMVLLSDGRPQGEWWKTPEDSIYQKHKNFDCICWYGTDNFFMRHPALVSLVTGLYRQSALLCKAKMSDRIIESIDYNRIEECLSSGDCKLAIELVNETRQWIEVPIGKIGSNEHYPFPLGQWRQLKCLQRARRRHGYNKILDQDFIQSWSLGDTINIDWSGMNSFWGNRTANTANRQRLLELGKLIRRKGSGNKQVPSLP